MSGDGETHMPVAAVRRHADSVDAAADGMTTGRSAAAQVRLADDAYGQLCSFLPGLVNPLADRTVTALDESAAALRETAANLRSAASAATSTDVNSARRIAATGGEAAFAVRDLPL